MDEFVLSIDHEIFRLTNQRWNELRLNDPWSVGYVSRLIEDHEFTDKSQWENYYYKSGEERNAKISNSPFNRFLNDESVPLNYSHLLAKLSSDHKDFNYNFGRTSDQLKNKGQILFNSLRSEIKGFTIEQSIECVRFRVICETWNGIVLREKKTLKTLNNLFPEIEFRKTTGAFDFEFGVDYEAYYNNRLMVGIQIKPQSYFLSDSIYIQKARAANKEKNWKYREKYSVPVHTIGSTIHGNVVNNESIVDIGQTIFRALNP